MSLAIINLKAFIEILSSKYKFHTKGNGPLKFHLGADFFRDEKTGTLHMTPKKYI